MCGITGILGYGSCFADLLREMGQAIAHRGPDDGNIWYDPDSHVGLSHRRLSILDLSEAGRQPMMSHSGRYVVAFNGEIYNHMNLREKVGDVGWRGSSDTESLLAGFEKWGIEQTIADAVGMFAFAVWDRLSRTLTLGRDRVGEKPLYYGWLGDGRRAAFVFGSELKSITMHPEFKGEVNRDAIALFLRHNCIPAPHSIYRGISKLPPGYLLNVSLNRRTPTTKPYWSASDVINNAITEPFNGSEDEAVDALEALLLNVVDRQMIADVPLGGFLSGGIDSSTVVALMQSRSSRPVKTYTIGFTEAGFNEAEYAKSVASHLGTEHTELYVTPKDAISVIPKLPALYDEPFADSSQIPCYLVSKLAGAHVKVALSGDGGDEIFAGYNRYVLSKRLWGKLSLLPAPLRSLLAASMTKISPQRWNALYSGFLQLTGNKEALSNFGDKLHKAAGVINCRSIDDLYYKLVSHWGDPTSVVRGAAEPATLITGGELQLPHNYVERMMALDLVTYLPDDILVKVDRAAMGVSLETRAPFLDHRVIEFAWRLPMAFKLQGNDTKRILKKLLYRYIPETLFNRPKVGFGIPLQDWLRGPLRDWAESLLDEKRLIHEGYFHPADIRLKWKEHLSGSRNWAYSLWDILMFQAWLESTREKSVSAYNPESLKVISG
ncbi:asparagine synthase (glutamine-hydrolyzing) [Hahella sp. KA22]|uniref:asparagine synthase (glutamine-hydrolyzing) n=1 Tax=Hahella sp. KA22 TaxID=1628392 RepID=UPI000FDF0AB4|nr:asparagine synthase (glutamine-hydrolyzing) [Hahella sp. KA22]AZZ91683.1 asparagine synthase (glutamine-hydrolyzing) [Hahella sp. KA22]QAY55053.1 asparagine synthase (glutamine-hydrolyzing) [Hahella sp. KA22]